MWLMLQQPRPDDYVLATGEKHTVREFCQAAFARAGMNLEFRGEGVDEIAIDSNSGREVLAIDPRYFRPTEVELLLGDASKAKRVLNWTPRVSFTELVDMMVDADLAAIQSGVPFTIEASYAALHALVK
jgi:GDPmannose 4,6-dehydratase